MMHYKDEAAINTVDVLMKIKAILTAAMFLISNKQETDAQMELIGIAEDIAVR